MNTFFIYHITSYSPHCFPSFAAAFSARMKKRPPKLETANLASRTTVFWPTMATTMKKAKANKVVSSSSLSSGQPRVFNTKKKFKWSSVLRLFIVVFFWVQCMLLFMLEQDHPSLNDQNHNHYHDLHHPGALVSSTTRNTRTHLVDLQIGTIQNSTLSVGIKIDQVADNSAAKINNNTSRNDDHVDIVITTDCSGYQHWQGILLYYSAQRVNHTGRITRIASGCTIEQQMKIQEEWQRIDPTQMKFQIYFAPSFALEGEHGGKYKYSNKPGGLLHWLKHQQQQREPLQGDSMLDNQRVIALLDPDMILLQPLTKNLAPNQVSTTTTDGGVTNLTYYRPHGEKQVEYLDQQGIARILRVKSLPQQDNLPTRVTTGHPAGQHFGVGGTWVQGGGSSAKPVWSQFNKSYICNGGSNSKNNDEQPCTTTSFHDASTKYAVGPVYLATLEDWNHIATTWWDFVPRVHEQYPHLLAEMFAFTMAVANLQLPFTLVSNYMITGASVTSPTEGWSWIDDLVLDDPQRACLGADTTTVPTWIKTTTTKGGSTYPGAVALPTTLHYCQRYRLDWNPSISSGNSNSNNTLSEEPLLLFSKHKVPHDFFSCHGSPLDIPISHLLDFLSQNNLSREQIRTAFALCQVIPTLGWALKQYQRDVCRNQ